MNLGKNPRGLRNNNPLNIRYDGTKWQGLASPATDGAFCRFKNFDYGYRAALKILETYYHKYKLRTIKQIVERWAPAADGNTPKQYATFVAATASTTPSAYLPEPSIDRMGWTNILLGMTYVECGTGIDEKRMRNSAKEAWYMLYED